MNEGTSGNEGLPSKDDIVQAGPEMCGRVFDVLSECLYVPARGDWEKEVPDASGVGVFVTFDERGGTSRSGEPRWRLRGCIGTLSPTKLRPALRNYTKSAAFHDGRFEPITQADLPNLKASVSVLSDFQDKEGEIYDWEIDQHGLILTLKPQGRNGLAYSATYLPEICGEQGWTKEECLLHLAEKSGFSGRITPKVLESATLTTYRSTKASLTYEEYAK